MQKTKIIKKNQIVAERQKIIRTLNVCTESYSTYIQAIADAPDQEEADEIYECCGAVLKLRKILKAQLDVFDFVLGVNDNYLTNQNTIE